MSKTYFIRIRGKSQGPYSSEQLRGFVKRGQFSRLHEVSVDGAAWSRAVNFPELFSAEEDVTAESLGLAPDPDKPADAVLGFPDHGPPTGNGQRSTRPLKSDAWYYTKNGAECGPIDFASLQKLAAGHQLGPQEQAWTEGMAEWAPLQTIVAPPPLPPQASLFADLRDLSADVRRGLYPDGDGRASELSAEACRAIAGTRPWMLFIAIFCYLIAVAYVVIGLLAISFVNGVVGLAEMVAGGLWAIGATLLVICFNRFGDVLHKRRQSELERGLHAMRRFWVFLGILLVVVLSLAAIFLLLLLALGSEAMHQFPRSLT